MSEFEQVQIEFVARGVRELSSAFDGVEARMRRLSQSEAAVADNSIRASDRAAAAKERAYQRVARETERWQKEAAKAEVSAVSQAAKAEGNARLDAAKRGAQIIKEEVKAVDLAEKEKTRSVERESARREAIVRRSSEMAGRLAEKEAHAVVQHREKMSRMLGGTAGRSAGAMLSSGVQLAGAALTIGGGFAIADAVKNTMSAQQSAALLVNAVTTSGEPPKGATVDNIVKAAGVEAVKTGIGKDQIIQGALAYSRAARGGDFQGAMENMGFFAKMSKVTGTDINELAGAAGKLQSQNPDLDSKAMQGMLLSAYAQSKAGSVSLSDAAAQIGTLGSTRGFYAGDTAKNQRTLIGLGQIAASGGVTGDMGTYIKDVSVEAAAHRHRKGHFAGLENMGVEFDSQGRMSSPDQMIGAVFKSTGGDLGKIHDIFGNRGLPLFTELSKSFTSAGGGEKGVAAVQAQIAGTTMATMTQGDLDKQFAVTMNTDAGKFSVALEHVQQSLEKALAPSIERLADKAPALADALGRDIEAAGKFADYLLDNPYKGIAAIISAKIMGDIAQAAIGEGVKRALATSIGQSAGKGGLIIGAATMAIALGMIAIDQLAQKDVESQQRAAINTATAGAKAATITAGVVSGAIPELSEDQMKALRERRAQAVSDIGATIAGREAGSGGFSQNAAHWEHVLDSATGGNRQQVEGQMIEQRKQEIAQIDQALAKAGKTHEDAATKAAEAFNKAGGAAGKLAVELGKVKAPGAGGAGGTSTARTTPIGQR